jgi:hypothetical protein
VHGPEDAELKLGTPASKRLQILRAVHRRVHPQAQAVQTDEAGGVVLVVGLGQVGRFRQTTLTGQSPGIVLEKCTPPIDGGFSA